MALEHEFDMRAFSGWPSGDYKEIFVLDTNIETVSKKLHVQFESIEDQLDHFWGAHVYHADIGFIVFAVHENRPVSGMEIWVDQNADDEDAMSVVQSILELTDDMVIYTAHDRS